MNERRFAELFLAERSRFALLFPRLARASLVLSDRYASPTSLGRERDGAWCEPSTLRVLFCARTLECWSDDRLHAVMLHELGHLVDGSTAPGQERRADDLAQQVTGLKIRYDDEGVQTLGPGSARPAWLHQ